MNKKEATIKENILAAVIRTCKELSDIELAALNTIAQLDLDPHNRLFDYEKVKHLFTEENGTQMHTETKIALAAIANIRLSNP